MPVNNLPRILYFSDVPVELSFAGATLMYRLLEHYPANKLLIVQGMEINPGKRIPGVQYYIYNSKLLDRLRKTRFSKHIGGFLFAFQKFKSKKLARTIDVFKPDIILTVSFRLMWLNALSLSKQLNIPLHLILHDDWITTENYGGWQTRLEEKFKELYLHASNKFCICPAMEAYYFSLYKVHGKILYPLRGKEDIIFSTSDKKQPKKLKYCYAGSMYTGDFPPMLNKLSALIEEQGDELFIFSNINKADLQNYEHLLKPHVKLHGLIDPADLMRIMHEEIDVAILLNSFLHEESFKYNFSSKLVDYTSAGLPVLFWGASSSGAISWAIASGYTAISTYQNGSEIKSILVKLKEASYRYDCARKLHELSGKHFSFEENYEIFISAISNDFHHA